MFVAFVVASIIYCYGVFVVNIYIYIKDQTMEQTTVELFKIYKTLLELLDECKNNQYLAKFSDELEKLVSDFEEWYPEIVSEYHFVNK